jgi:hypothetical protein
VRKCSTCGKDDRTHPTGGPCKCQKPEHEPDCDAIEHYVKPEIKFIQWAEHEFQKQLRLIAKGWKFRQYQGRNAMYRYTCIDCLRAQAEIDRMAADHKRLGKRAEQDDEMSYYDILTQ